MSDHPMYAIQAQIESTHGDWHTSRQVPTFYLDPNVQGIMSEQHAEEIARAILPNGQGIIVHVSVGLA